MLPEKYSPQVASLIPLFYIGWSDAVLGPSEIKLIQNKINNFDWIKERDKQLLLSWMDPTNPPSDSLHQEWAESIQSTAQSMNSDGRQTLVDLGIEMAKIQSDNQTWLTPKVVEALKKLEEAIGIVSLELHSHLLTQQQIIEEREATLNHSNIDVKALQHILDDDYIEIRANVFKILHDPMFNLETIRNKETYREHVLKWVHLLAEQGYGALHFPKEYGGIDDMGAYAAVFETLGYHDLSLVVKFGVQFGLWGGSVLWLGTEKHHKRYLNDIGTMKLPGCFAMTETGHGSNVRDCETTATYDPVRDEIIINSPTLSSGKDYIGNAAAHGQMASVFAQLIVDGKNHGVHAILVDIRDEEGNIAPGVSIEDCAYKLGLNGVDNGRIWFDQVRVPRFNLLNRFGNIDEHGIYSSPIEKESKRFFTMLGTLVGGRMCVPRAGLSAAKASLTIAIRYALKRRQFGEDGKPEMLIMDYPSHQRRLMPPLAKAYALDFALTYLTDRFSNRTEEDMREIETLAAGLKSVATWYTTKTIQECREACGGKGYLAENRFADFKADSDIFTTFEGDNTVLMQLVAKGVLGDFNKEIVSGGLLGMVNFASERFIATIREKNFVNTHNTDEGHLKDPTFQLDAFVYRERDLMVSVGQRLRKFIKRGIPSYQAFLRCQTHMIEVAHAYIDRIILEQFLAQIEGCEDAALKKTLKMLCDLYALHTIEENKGWYLEQGCMSGAKTRAIRRVVDKLCKEVRNDAFALVEAFGIPDACLAAPIAVF
ncbi:MULTISPECIES: acyl-CoA dehydrogenase [unclassified Aureispira]|uniref:acyl-CoA dehydrogenase family protein n=1 Tax=unclassified Aureispira TaxID=2649989 RepID=UPI000697A549|nr:MULTISPECIES: acyl-CoA dehydrogenase [unclassified Aureispira]WMX12036.1 acyl-CoA dehydrogenase [Aureispira sp. CCB-E]